MYVEISGRGTGKTHRLIEHAANEVLNNIYDPSHTITVVSHSPTHGRQLRNQIVDRITELSRYVDHVDYLSGLDVTGRIDLFFSCRVRVRHTMDVNNTDIGSKFYVDEFGLIDSNNLVLNDDAYYVTSPNIGHEFTELLVSYCGYHDIEIMSNTFMTPYRKNELVNKKIKRHRFTHGRR